MTTSRPLAILAGVSLGVYQRSQRWKPSHRGWDIRVVSSQQHARAELQSIWKRVLSEYDANSGSAHGTHLLLAHDREDQRPDFERDLWARSIRAVWLPREVSTQYGSEDCRRAIARLLRFEELWRTRIRPTLNTPLILPEPAFTADSSVRDSWKRARKVHSDRDNLDAVGASIRRFSERHRQGQVWLDRDKLVFQSGAPHGTHGLPGWRAQKLTCQLPKGHHYDVKHERGRAFDLSDHGGSTHRFDTYTNVDAHGFVRGGQ